MWSTLLELDKINEGIFDKPSLNNWVTASGQKINLNNTQPAIINQPSSSVKPAISSPNGKCVVVIISDKGRLRAFGTDGVNPGAFVAFPNNLRQFEGQKYEVDQLIWNGKNYRVSGNIKEITTPNLTTNTTSNNPAKVHSANKLVINNYENHLYDHIAELSDEGDYEEEIEYFENFPGILEVVQRGSDIIIKLSSEPANTDDIYWILTYALGAVGVEIADDNRYHYANKEIIISEADFNDALNYNLNN